MAASVRGLPERDQEGARPWAESRRQETGQGLSLLPTDAQQEAQLHEALQDWSKGSPLEPLRFEKVGAGGGRE